MRVSGVIFCQMLIQLPPPGTLGRLWFQVSVSIGMRTGEKRKEERKKSLPTTHKDPGLLETSPLLCSEVGMGFYFIYPEKYSSHPLFRGLK